MVPGAGSPGNGIDNSHGFHQPRLKDSMGPSASQGPRLQEVDDAEEQEHVLALGVPLVPGLEQGLRGHGRPQLGLGDAVQAQQLVRAPAPPAAAPAQEVCGGAAWIHRPVAGFTDVEEDLSTTEGEQAKRALLNLIVQ